MVSRPERDMAVRRLLDGEGTPPPVPPEVCADVLRHGTRLLRRRLLARRLLWTLLVAASVAFVVWALTVRPWVEPPSDTTPPLTGW